MIRHEPGRIGTGAVLDVGLKCVHSCKFCYYSYLDGSDDQFAGMRKAEFRSFEECKEILERLKAGGFTHADITGGEPTLHKDIVQIVQYGTDLGIPLRLITLGQYLMRPMFGAQRNQIEELLDAGLTDVLFSYHSASPALFEELTGGSLEKLESAMDYLDERSFDYSSNTVVVEDNYKYLPEVAKSLQRHRVYSHNFILMNAYHSWSGGKAQGLQARYSEVRSYLEEAVRYLDEAGVAVNIRYAPLCQVRGMEKHLVGIVGVRFDPHEWMNAAGHLGGRPEECARRLQGEDFKIPPDLEIRFEGGYLPEGFRVIGQRPSGKVFAGICSTCGAIEVCDGIDHAYLRRYGPKELEPYREWHRPPLHEDRLAYAPAFSVKTEQWETMTGRTIR
jgi:pyrroloquinoline quinone biosynthesis protein E